MLRVVWVTVLGAMDERTARTRRWRRWEPQTRSIDPIVGTGVPPPLGWMPSDAAGLLCLRAYGLQEAGDGRLHQPLRGETIKYTVDASLTEWTGGMQNLLSQLSRGGLREIASAVSRAGWRTEARAWGGPSVCCQRRSPKRFWAGGTPKNRLDPAWLGG
jgi:hypothetical protein